MKFNYIEEISAFRPRQRKCFYELLASFLTVSMRGILFSEGIPDEERIDRAKGINEIAHRITYKVFSLDNNPSAKTTEAEIWTIIKKILEKHPVEADLEYALNLAYNYVIENHSDDL